MRQAAQQRMSYLSEARNSALMQQRLMTPIADEHRENESQSPNGLIILVARYGKNPSKCPKRDAEQQSMESKEEIQAINVDVTIPLQFFTNVSEFMI